MAQVVASVAAGRGRAVLVEGEAGIGKTALLAAVLRAAETAGCRVVRASADELIRRFPLQLLVDALDLPATAGSDPGPSSLPFSSVDPVVGLAERVAARVDSLCAAGPTVLAVDDLQWADEASLAVLSRLTASVAQLPLLLITTCRLLPQRPELAQLRRTMIEREATVVELGPLTDEESTEVAAGVAGAPVGRGLRGAIAAGGGNPFYVREIVDALVRSGAVTVTAGSADLAPRASPRPVTLTGAVLDRLGFLTADTREVLRLAGLLGPEVVVAELVALTGRTPVELLPAVDEAVRGGVLTASGERLVFRHALIRDSLHGSIPEAVRGALHRQAAEALTAVGASPDRVLRHVVLAAGPSDAWTTAWLGRHAAGLATRLPAVLEELLAQVLEGPLPDGSVREQLETVLVDAAFRHRSFRRVEDVATRMLARGVDAELAARTTWMLGYALMVGRRLDEAVTVVVYGIAGAPPVWSGRLGALHALLLLSSGDYATAGARAQEVLRLGSGADPAAAGYARHVLSILEVLGRSTGTAVALIDDALDGIGDDVELVDLRVLLMLNRAQWAEHAGEVEASLRAARTLSERFGGIRSGHCAVAAGTMFYWIGRWDDAVRELDTELVPEHELEARPVIRDGLSALIAARRGDVEAARRHLAAQPARPATGISTANADYALLARVVLAERAGDHAVAAALLAPTVDLDRDEPATHRHVWVAAVVRTALAAGDTALAQRAAQAAASDGSREPAGIRATAARWCAAVLDGDVAALEACVECYRAAGFRTLLADVCVDTAVACAAAGDVPRARARLAEATAILVELGADWELRRADARLRALGVRRGPAARVPRAISGWAALTGTELRIAELVAVGRSNPAIAAELFLSRRTVENHVSRILAKLGARSRAEVAHQAATRT